MLACDFRIFLHIDKFFLFFDQKLSNFENSKKTILHIVNSTFNTNIGWIFRTVWAQEPWARTKENKGKAKGGFDLWKSQCVLGREAEGKV